MDCGVWSEVHEVHELELRCMRVNFVFGPFRSVELVLENGFEK